MKEVTIKEYIQKSIDEVESALREGYAVHETINFEVAVITSRSKNGGLNIKVASGNYIANEETVQRLSFSIINAAQRDRENRKLADSVIEYLGMGMEVLASVGTPSNQEEAGAVKQLKPKYTRRKKA